MRTILCLMILAVIGIFANKNPEEGSMVEGDMEMDPEQMSAYLEQMGKQDDLKESNNAFAAIKAGLWKTNGRADTIKYYIDSRIRGATEVINQAIADYQRYTCIRFQKYNSRPSGPHIYFTTGSGCSSPVGRMRSGNSVRLARGCWYKGTVMHEIGHSIGLFHEQSRPDRDDYVTIRWENIHSNMKYNFNKMKTSNWAHHDTAYDYDSMMHYGSRFFSRNGRNTIETKNSKDQGRIGSRKGFSEIDIKQINRMYCNGNSGGSGGSGGTGGSGGSGCSDKDNRCSGWKSYCSSNDYVKDKCKKTCGTCGGTGGGTGGTGGGSCEDKHSNCRDNIKGCSEWGQVWIDWMKKYCQKTCNFC